MMNRQLTCAAILAVALSYGLGNFVIAQERISNQKNSPAVKQSVADVAAPLAASVVEVQLESRTVALGTIVSSDGLVVTKASECQASGGITCRFSDQRSLPANIVATDNALDLALIRVQAEGLHPADLSQATPPTTGSFLISVGAAGRTLGLGIATVDPRKFNLRHSDSADRGYLGVNCSSDDDRRCLVVNQVTEDSAARRAGIRQGDFIISINQQPVTLVEQLVREVRQHKAGDGVELIVQRGEQRITVRTELGRQPWFEPFDQWGGGPFSKRRFGFDAVIVHDTPIEPNSCGGPIVDTEGRVVGVNIARALRVATYAHPASAVAAFVEKNARTPEIPTSSSE